MTWNWLMPLEFITQKILQPAASSEHDVVIKAVIRGQLAEENGDAWQLDVRHMKAPVLRVTWWQLKQRLHVHKLAALLGSNYFWWVIGWVLWTEWLSRFGSGRPLLIPVTAAWRHFHFAAQGTLHTHSVLSFRIHASEFNLSHVANRPELCTPPILPEAREPTHYLLPKNAQSQVLSKCPSLLVLFEPLFQRKIHPGDIASLADVCWGNFKALLPQLMHGQVTLKHWISHRTDACWDTCSLFAIDHLLMNKAKG